MDITMSTADIISKRILKDKVVPEDTWLGAILNVTELLTNELQKRLIEEGRFSGMAKSYINSMWETYTDINPVLEDDEWEIYCRINYLLKPTLLKEYRYLISKRLSPGDCFIVMLKKIYEIIEEIIKSSEASKDFQYTRQLRTLLKLTGKFFDNIRNKKKTAKLFNISDTLKYCIETGVLGKYKLEKIDFSETTSNSTKLVDILEKPGDRLEIGENNIVTEVEWNGGH